MSRRQAGEILAMGVQKHSDPQAAKTLAKAIGYNDSPLFGAEKKRTRLVAELVMLNTALTVFAINQVIEMPDAKTVIDYFLDFAKRSMFSVIAPKDPAFHKSYESRMAQYFAILSADKPILGLSFAFLKNLGIDPLSNIQSQMVAGKLIADTLSKGIAVLRTISLAPNGA